ncbi:MAG: RNA-binding S4 domain-containing protein [Lachnospiraceae bacterium]|nr:RNA-binding S4 domain-containing protein [Lachnospiraceae bacterium]
MNFKIREGEEFIKLGQLLKACNLVSNGGEAKERILSGEVKVNGEVETARGKKIKPGDTVSFADTSIDVS